MNVFVTGGTGFVGSFTANLFAQNGHKVVCFDRKPRPTVGINAEHESMSFIEGDILDQSRLVSLLDELDINVVIHTAAVIGQVGGKSDPRWMFQINVEGTLSMLEAVRAKRAGMVYVSTATLYGIHPDLHPLSEDATPDPVGMYDTTKLMAETLAVTYHKIYGLDIVAVRPGYVYGPGNSTGGYYLDRLFAGERLLNEQGADLPMDVTYVKDLAQGIYLAATVRPIKNRIFNVTGGVSRRRSEVAAIAQHLVPGSQIEVSPGIPSTAHLRGPSDLSRARSELGFEPAFTLEQGMADWLAYLEAEAGAE